MERRRPGRPRQRTPKAFISISVPPPLLARIQQAAEREGLAVAAWVRRHVIHILGPDETETAA